INFWAGVGDVLHTVRMEQFPNRDLAVIAGANALFEWAKLDPDRQVPAAALEYWDNNRNNPGLTFQDVQMDLESRWGIQFGAKQIDGNEPPHAPPPRRVKETEPRYGRTMEDNGQEDVDIVVILKRRHADQTARVRAIDAEIAAKEKLREKVAYD